MTHHKRGRPKNRRAGCLLCKPWKANGNTRKKHSDAVAAVDHDEQERLAAQYINLLNSTLEMPIGEGRAALAAGRKLLE